MRSFLKKLINGALRPFGCSIVGHTGAYPPPGRSNRPIANILLFLEDINARGIQCQGILDIGANEGEWTRMAMKVFPAAKYLLIEPQAEMATKLDLLSAEHKNVEYVLAGAGSKESELIQTIYEDHRGSTFLPDSDPALVQSGKQRKTKVITVDALLKNRDFSPDIVKLDIQGFELEALRGALSCFGRTEIFIVETALYRYYDAMPLTREIIQFMADQGYELYDITEYLRRPFDGALGQVDLAFARTTGHLRKSSKWAS